MLKRAPIRSFAIAASLLLGSVGAVVVAGPAEAATFNNSRDGQDSLVGAGSTTLKYANGHGTFTTTISVHAAKLSGKVPKEDLNAAYSIKMYNAKGQTVWSAAGQRSRSYFIGSNVTKIVITPAGPYVGAAVNWRS